MQNQSSPPTIVWYVLWLGLIYSVATTHWIYPLIVFALGGVLLHNSQHGEPLRRLIAEVQARTGGDRRKAEAVSFATGLVLTGLMTVALTVVQNQQYARDMAEREEAAQLAQQEAAVAEARAREAEARAAVAQAEAERVKAQQEAEEARAAELRRQQEEEAAQQRQAQREEEQRQRELEEQAAQQAEEEARQQAEMERQAAEGPYTKNEVENLCREKVGDFYGVERMAVHQQGSDIEILDSPPRNMEFGGQRVWNWEATFNIAGTSIYADVQCTVFPDGEVRIGDQ